METTFGKVGTGVISKRIQRQILTMNEPLLSFCSSLWNTRPRQRLHRNIQQLVKKQVLFIIKPRGYAIQHITVPVPSQDKLGGLRQEGHLA